MSAGDPDDLGPVNPVKRLDALAWIARENPERVRCIRHDARKHLYREVGGARLVGPLASPTDDQGSDLRCPFELRDPQIAKVLGDPVEPGVPGLLG